MLVGHQHRLGQVHKQGLEHRLGQGHTEEQLRQQPREQREQQSTEMKNTNKFEYDI